MKKICEIDEIGFMHDMGVAHKVRVVKRTLVYHSPNASTEDLYMYDVCDVNTNEMLKAVCLFTKTEMRKIIEKFYNETINCEKKECERKIAKLQKRRDKQLDILNKYENS